MNAAFLFHPDGTETDISICGKCGAPARGRDRFFVSQRCCTCWECGRELETSDAHYTRYGPYHQDCERARQQRIEAAALEKAELIENYDGPVYFEGGHGILGDSFFANVYELAEWLDDKNSGVCPDFVHCCRSSAVAVLNFDFILESYYGEYGEFLMPPKSSLNGCEELRTAIDAFNAANKDLIAWDADFKRKCRVPARLSAA